jgi:Zn-dependent protease with chaperone function
MRTCKPSSLPAVRRKWLFDIGVISLLFLSLAGLVTVAVLYEPALCLFLPAAAVYAAAKEARRTRLARAVAYFHVLTDDADSRRKFPAAARSLDASAKALGIPPPRFHVLDDLGSIANSWHDGKVHVVAVRGSFLVVLPDVSVSAIVAHEAAHVRNRDAAVSRIVAVLLGCMWNFSSLLAASAFVRFAAGIALHRGDVAFLLPAVVTASTALAGLAGAFLTLWKLLPPVFRQHEFAADALGAAATDDPMAAAVTLAVFLVSFGEERGTGLEKHPPLLDRIQALVALAKEKHRP